MFDIKEEQCNTKTDRLLYNIWQELKKMNEPKDKYSKMNRRELIAEIKNTIDNPPKGWTRFSNEQMIALLRGESNAS